MWDPKDTYLLAVLGSIPRICVTREKTKSAIGTDLTQSEPTLEIISTYKYINYYITTHGVLLKRLAKYYGIPDSNVLILAQGTKEAFSVQNLTNNKLYLQLSATEIYEIDINDDDINFNFYGANPQNFDRETTKIRRLIKNKNARILFFLDDHGLHHEFAGIPNLKLYLPFYRIPHASLRIFNDSCHSETMLELIDKFFVITDIINRHTNGKGIESNCIKIISKLASNYDKKNQQISSIEHIIVKLEHIYNTDIQDIYPECSDILDRLHLINNEIKSFEDSEMMSKDNHTLLLHQYDDKALGNALCKLGIVYFSDFYDLSVAFSRLDQNLLNKVDTVLNKQNFEIAKEIFTRLRCKTSDDLYQIISDIEAQEIENVCSKLFGFFLVSPHEDHQIITTAPSNGLSVTFGTRRVKGTDVKVIMGSPGFGAFIDEVFLNVTSEPIKVEKIREYAVGGKQKESDKNKCVEKGEGEGGEEEGGEEEEESIEYASVCRNRRGEKIRKQWIRLHIKDYSTGKLSSGRFFSEAQLKNPPSRREILEKVGFRLVQEFEVDGETPKDESNNLFVEPKKRTRIRYQRSEFDPDKLIEGMSYFERGSFAIRYPSEDDEYYSDDEVYDDDGNIRSSTSMSASDEEGGVKDLGELTEDEADKIITALRIPHYGWGADIYDFIVAALKKKTKRMKCPFDPEKEGRLSCANYHWARNCLRGFFPTCEICDANKLILLISDFALQNELESITTDDPCGRLIQSICRIGGQKIPFLIDPPKKR